jgi:hypothetical protein
MAGIYIGFSLFDKQKVIANYCATNRITKVYFFSSEEFKINLDLPVPIEYISYSDIIMYKTFYRLLEEIDDDKLLVFNECMRTQNRNDLTYNCAHHYCNQTPHKLVFEYFPFIEQPEDFMILLNFINKSKYKGKSFDYQFIRDEQAVIVPAKIKPYSIDVGVTEKEKQLYQQKKEQLFCNLGQADPDTIPRQLHNYVGAFKKRFLEPEQLYVARNSRFGLSNVISYSDVEAYQDYIIVDFPHRRIDFNDFIKKTMMHDVYFVNTGLKVDNYYFNELKSWVTRLEEFYAKAGVC